MMTSSRDPRNERILLWGLLALGLMDRAFAVVQFGAKFLSTDDAIIWAAAVDHAHGLFHGPYYYGQNYGPMLEALVAAPFIRCGAPLWWVMPIVTTVLGMLPYWSFTIWHLAHRRTNAAICFAALPLLLPVEFNLMTTMSRGFVTGLAPLALLPWILDLRSGPSRSILTGVTIAVAWYVNPNSVIFTAGYACWYMLTNRPLIKTAALLLIGLAPGVVAHLASQAWCEAHPDRIVHHLRPEQFAFEPSLLYAGLSALDAHFQWLMPMVWPIGSLLGAFLLALLVIAIWRRMGPLALGLTASVLVTTLSLGLGKIHEGWDPVFFPLSRMFLALPLWVVWAFTQFVGTKRFSGTLMIRIALLTTATVLRKATSIERTIYDQVMGRTIWVHVDPIHTLRTDARRMQRIANRHGAGLIVPFAAKIWPQFHSYLYPVLEPGLAPTYYYGYERRYWQRDRFAKAVVPVILFVGGSTERWSTIMNDHPEFIDPHDAGPDDVHVLIGNKLPTDSLAHWLNAQLGSY